MDSSSSQQQLFLFSFWFLLLSSLPKIAKSTENYCPLTFCGDNIFPVKFPFQLRNRPTSFSRCVYPGFELSCNSLNQTILNLPDSGPFMVQHIDYMTQSLLITDPENCLPNRLLRGFKWEDSAFEPDHLGNFTFLNCSSSETIEYEYYRVMSCLSGQNYTVLAGPTWNYNESTLPSSCERVSTVMIPVSWRFGSGIDVYIGLVWSRPSCGNCEELDQACGFKSSKGLDTGCSNFPRLGISRNAKYSIVLGVGIPALCCMIGLGCYLCSRVRAASQRRRGLIAELSTSAIAPRTSVVLTGLDGPTIEAYPKTLLGESKRLPRPNDNTCSICLCEYQAKETLRTIPECNHYFHADCIDAWLKMKASCPVCRNSPDSSTFGTPSFASTSSSSRPSTSSSTP